MCRTDLFVHVTNLIKGHTVWAHFVTTGYIKTNSKRKCPNQNMLSMLSKDAHSERSRNLDHSFRNIYIIPSFPTREQHAHSVQNARSRFTKLNQ